MVYLTEIFNTGFNFDDIADTQLDDIKQEPTKNSAHTVMHKWIYPKLVQFVTDVFKKDVYKFPPEDLILSVDEQNSLFSNCINNNIYYLFPDKETLEAFIRRYSNVNPKANLNWIDTSNITNMSYIFSYLNFNGDISQWDVSNVIDMSNMFRGSLFDGDISQWDVSSVKNMNTMFNFSQFNGDISKWDVSNVIDMSYMFKMSKFNQDISAWDVSNVTDMKDMFSWSNFNQNISKWNILKGTDIYLLFYHCPIKEEYKPTFK